MTKQKQPQEVSFEEVVERGCGLDVHKNEIVATVSVTGINEPASRLVEKYKDCGCDKLFPSVSAKCVSLHLSNTPIFGTFVKQRLNQKLLHD